MPWDPLHDLVAIRDRSAQRAAGSGAWTPPVDVYEMPAEYVVVAELPGFSAGDFGIAATATTLTLTGRRAAPDLVSGQFLRLERGQGEFGRTFTFPEAIDVARIRADLESGLLTIHVPKATALQTRRIEIG
jgi:HSP20 family protein